MAKRADSRLKRAEALIRTGKYEEARKLLQSMKNDPVALRLLESLNIIRPPKKQLSVIGRVGLAAGILFLIVVVVPQLFESPEARAARYMQRTLTAQAGMSREETPATILTSVPPTPSPEPTFTLEVSFTETSITPTARLEQAIAASVGVERVNLVSVLGDNPVIVHVEMVVVPPYNTVAVADMVFRQALAVTNSAAMDFTVIIDDGILPVSYRWDNEIDRFVTTELNEAATAIASLNAIFTVSPFPALPPAQVSTQPATIPTRFLFSCNQIDDLNCPDFERTGASADEHLLRCGNEDGIDRDGDGDACEPGWD